MYGIKFLFLICNAKIKKIKLSDSIIMNYGGCVGYLGLFVQELNSIKQHVTQNRSNFI